MPWHCCAAIWRNPLFLSTEWLCVGCMRLDLKTRKGKGQIHWCLVWRSGVAKYSLKMFVSRSSSEACAIHYAFFQKTAVSSEEFLSTGCFSISHTSLFQKPHLLTITAFRAYPKHSFLDRDQDPAVNVINVAKNCLIPGWRKHHRAAPMRTRQALKNKRAAIVSSSCGSVHATNDSTKIK